MFSYIIIFLFFFHKNMECRMPLLISSKNRLLHMQITADSMGVYTKVFSLGLCPNFDVIRQWSVQWCLVACPACLQLLYDFQFLNQARATEDWDGCFSSLTSPNKTAQCHKWGLPSLGLCSQVVTLIMVEASHESWPLQV